jgi:two-component system, sensor histidine kinase ChiS
VIATVPGESRGRVLVVGGDEASAAALKRLRTGGYSCTSVAGADALLSLAPMLRPEAIVVTDAGALEKDALAELRKLDQLRGLPVLADLSGQSADALLSLGFDFDDRVHSLDELTARVEAALRAKRLIERDASVQRRMEALLDITQAATSSLELEEILRIAVEKVSRVIATDRCSVVLVEGAATRAARVVASLESLGSAPLHLDLARYPELRRALSSGEVVHVEDAARDPLMEEVRSQIEPLGVKSILVQPLVSHDDVLGALFLRLSRTTGFFGKEDRELTRAVAAALANSIRNARLHAALRRKREELESAYVDRYRELNDANRRLREANRFKDEIIAICSHDLRAPLQVLLGHARLLLDQELSDLQKSSVDAIVRQSRKILSLVESLLERGRSEQGRLSLEPTALDIAEMCRETAQELEILAADRGVELLAEPSERLMLIGDEMKLREVLQNLVTNGISHAREGGRVMVQAQRLLWPDGDVARVTVQDDGRGIPVDQLHQVFDRYHHGPGGTGLGLAICKEFVELHGGEVWAENRADAGCAFIFTVPLARTPEQSQPMRVPRKIESGDLPRVLLVEDEPEVASLVAEIFRARYRVELARDGAEGLAKARMLQPDLIVMDVFLPRLDGLDAAVALKSSSDTAYIPLILLSAHQDIAEKVRALNLGATDYITKPFQALELLGRAERAIRSGRESAQASAVITSTGVDPQTGALDREGLLNRLEQEVSRSLRYQRPLSLALLFPLAELGDQLRGCADLIRGRLRSPDLLAHLGNGMFALVLPESPLGAARGICARILPELHRLAGVAFKNKAIDVAKDGRSAQAVLEQLLSVQRLT